MKNGESLKQFLTRFKIPALAYLNIVSTDYNSSKSQTFSMTLLINAKLGDQSFANMISTLINSSRSTTDDKD